MATTHEGKAPVVIEEPKVSTDRTIIDSEEFVQKNKKILSIITGVLIGAAALFFGYRYYINSQDEEAQSQMFQAVYYFEADSLTKALKGDGKDLGLADVADTYSGTPAGNLANFYAGVAYLKNGKYDEAIESLKNFGANDLLVQGRAYSLIGDAYMEKKELDNATEYYKKAAEYKPNEFFTPRYLMKLAFAYELQNDFESAIKAYDEIIEKYSKASEVNDAKKYKAKAEASVSK
jgi:tetratricopeptide (TPR) repeat protein